MSSPKEIFQIAFRARRCEETMKLSLVDFSSNVSYDERFQAFYQREHIKAMSALLLAVSESSWPWLDITQEDSEKIFRWCSMANKAYTDRPSRWFKHK